MSSPADMYQSVRDEVGKVLIGQEDLIKGLTIASLTGGHVLLEGVPGIAKTTAARLYARAIGLDYSRIQMTPDLLPADITGTRIYRQQTGEFETERGPVFANVVLADEINRATPKTQSALLESMQEGQVTIDGEEMSLPTPFLVIATQNPVEMDGVFSLPEAQRDRFQLKITVGTPGRDDERAILDRFDDNPNLGPDDIDSVVDTRTIMQCREAVSDVHAAGAVKEYALDIAEATRDHDATEHGASPRASIAFIDAGKGLAAINGRDYVIPDDLKDLAYQVLSHRLVLDADANLRNVDPDDVIEDVLDRVEPPTDGFTPDPDSVEVDGESTEVATDGSTTTVSQPADDA
ncbi:AAA family ATPase [Natronomonas marina]|jgi:MoxR-like ATPase|uniref:AAA family ATPase n=1 Tax=Natronomonas marina TaxID=2961939 RepID=UPI0020CA1D6F|nr:MoxR family ATPase [Natronomonas marina]